MKPRKHPLETAFALLLALLPPGPLRREDATSMRLTLQDQVEQATDARARLRVTWRAVRRVPGVVAHEWLEWLAIRARSSRPSTGAEGDGMLGRTSRNLGFALRTLRKSPTFAFATVLLVALGVGTVTSAFTVVDHVMLRPLPYPSADRLVYLTNGSHNGPTLERLNRIEAFESWTAVASQSVNLTRPDGDPLRLQRVEVTAEYFTLFGARPELGRLFVDADENDTDLAVLGFAFWRDVFGSDTDVVGRTMVIDGSPIEIIGVLTADFVPPDGVRGEADFFRPLDWDNPGFENPGYHAHSVVGRLEPTVSLAQANEQIDRLEVDVAAAHPEYYSDGPRDWPLESLQASTVSDVRSGLLLLMGAVSLLLLVACANVAHLFMARGLTRAREMSIRRALGAGTWNLIGQLSAESLAVGLLGGITGLAFAQSALALLRRWTTELPRGADIAIDLRVFTVCIGLATLTALVFGLIPALRSIGRDVGDGLRAGGRGTSGGRGVQVFRGGLVIFEVAVSLVLVASAGLLMRSFLSVTAVDPGVEAEDVWVLRLNLVNVESPEQYRNRTEPLRRALLSVPGVTTVTYGIEAPFEHVGGNSCCWSNRAALPDQPEVEAVRVMLHPVSEDHFETFGTELVAGAAWGAASAAATPAPAVLSEALAIRFFGSAEAAVGREVDAAGGVIVAGVAEPTRHYGLDQPHEYAVYLPMEALPFDISRATFALRAAQLDGAFARQVREAIWSQEPGLPVPEVTTLEAWISDSSSTRRFGSVLLGAFGVVALLLAGAGLYGTLLYTVGQRRQELGIRLALGAGRGRIQGDVIRRGVIQAGAGVLIGAAVALWVGGFLEAFLFGISSTDPLALSSAAAILFITAVAASWLPAYRAGRTDPLETLKAE